MELELSRKIFEKTLNNSFMRILPVGRIVPCGRREGQTHTTKLIVTFRSFANAPKNTRKQQHSFPRPHYCLVAEAESEEMRRASTSIIV